MRPTLSALLPSKPGIRLRHLLALGALLAPLALAAPPAAADRCDLIIRTSRGYDRGNDRGFSRSYDRTYGRSYTRRSHVSAPSGYYKQVYRPAIYRTVYDACGQASRVCVRAARYERVWVSTGRSHRSRW